MTSMQRAEALRCRNAEDTDRPTVFHMLGRDWDLLPEVFAPTYTPVTELFTSWLDYPVGGDFLEIGPGAGVTTVTAALRGCRSVTAIDIGSESVTNTRHNAARHRVTDRVRVLRGDLFEGLVPDERFDMIFWNSNFTEVPNDRVNTTDLHHAFFDPGYRAHRRYLLGAAGHMRPGGRLLLGFADIGNTEHLERLASEAGLDGRVVRTKPPTTEHPIEFRLIEFAPQGGRRWN